ncbi:MAG: hypothetical protein ACT4O2_10355 [Beijerinckiaceae bacterium]
MSPRRLLVAEHEESVLKLDTGGVEFRLEPVPDTLRVRRLLVHAQDGLTATTCRPATTRSMAPPV